MCETVAPVELNTTDTMRHMPFGSWTNMLAERASFFSRARQLKECCCGLMDALAVAHGTEPTSDTRGSKKLDLDDSVPNP